MTKQKTIFLALIIFTIYTLGYINETSTKIFAAILMVFSIILIFSKSQKKEVEQKVEEKKENPPKLVLGNDELELEEQPSLFHMTKEYRKNQRESAEKELTKMLNKSLFVIKKAIKCNTASIFFIHGENAIFLKAFNTPNKDAIIQEAVIEYGKGLIGMLAKNKNDHLLENDIIANSTTLYYYNSNIGIHSIAAVPINVKGNFKGIIAVDSLEKDSFSNSDIELLKNFSDVIGNLALNSYLQIEHKIDRERISTLKNVERDFLDAKSVDHIIKMLGDICKQALDYDRLMITIKEDIDTAKVVLADGEDADFFQGFEFRIDEPGVVNLTLSRNTRIHRMFDSKRLIPRFSSREKINDSLRVIISEPLGSKSECIGALSIESKNEMQYASIDMEILQNLTTAASFALEKTKNLESMKKMATKDGLTGLANHREFQNLLKQEIIAANRYKHFVGLIMTDIDYFKKVNDTYGHPVGDIVLKEISKILQENIRQGVDHVARYGGEEFVVILGNANEQILMETAERIRKIVEEKEINIGTGRTINVNMSLGCSIYPQNAKTQKDLIDKTDKALYRAKETGRNKVVRAK